VSDELRFVIVGAGLAAGKAAEALRSAGFGGSITIIGDEPHPPYERPALSKGFLLGKAGEQDLQVHSAGWYEENSVRLLTGVAVIEIDRAQHELVLSDGRRIGYDKVLLTTGASPRRLDLPGADAEGVRCLRTVADSQAIRASLESGGPVAVVGAGWIGLETAAAARSMGLAVTVIEREELPLLPVLGPEVARLFAALHTRHGVDLRTGAEVAEFTISDGRVTGVRLGDGSLIPADTVLVGVGVSPNTALAEQAGLSVSNGIDVDESLRSSDPDILAAGDVANAYLPRLGKRIRVEHWANALNQPATAALSMLDEPAVYDRIPYFYTDQYELGMEYTGYVEPGQYDQVVFRGDPAGGEFIAFWVADGRVLAGMNVNIWDVTDDIKALIGSGGPVDLEALADPTVPLSSLMAEAPGS
jgi:3-phenylpropionate/trans-cinnamate dioxygenase ferredoxin reductase subunit